MSLHSFNQALTVTGTIVSVDPGKSSFSVEARSGDIFEAIVGRETYYSVLSNLDGLDRNRVPEAQPASGEDGVLYNLRKYAVQGRPVSVTSRGAGPKLLVRNRAAPERKRLSVAPPSTT